METSFVWKDENSGKNIVRIEERKDDDEEDNEKNE